MSAWSQAVWVVNQIKNTVTKDYITVIDNLSNRYNTFVEQMDSNFDSCASSFVRNTAPSQGSFESGIEKGALCFIIEE